MDSPSQFFSSQPTKKIKLSETESSTKLLQNQSEPSLRDYESHSPLLFSPSKSVLNFPKNLLSNESKKKGIAWSSLEDDLLKKAVEQHSAKNWKEICKTIPGRTSSQCSQRWKRIQPYKNRQPWTKDEDKLLADLTQKFGCNWSLISSIIEGRTGKQVRERYINKLDPKIDRTKFKEEEDQKILKMYKELGPKWREISKSFQGRPENMIKNRFYSYIKKKYGQVVEGDKMPALEEEKKDEFIVEDEKKNTNIEMADIQSKFDLLLCKSETKKDPESKKMEILKDKPLEEHNPMEHNPLALGNLLISKEKEMSTEYTFNLENLQQQEQGKPENQFVNNLGTKFLFNAPEENELDFFLYDKNRENPINYNEFEGFSNLKNENEQGRMNMFKMEEEQLEQKDEKLERMSFLNKKKEIIESMLANVLNKIQECESNK